MNTKRKSIGFFDSGAGGISVLKESINLLPKENYIYLGDNYNAPYGNKSESEIRSFSLNCADILYRKGVKAIVIACNTATSISVREMRDRYNIPVISIEPAVKPALKEVTDGNILVMATPATLSQDRYKSLIERIGEEERIVNAPCPGLADLIEKYDPDSSEINSYLNGLLTGYKDACIKGIVLGCTHYSLIDKKILEISNKLLGNEIKLFDGKYGVARQLKKVLEENDLLNDCGSASIHYFVTGDNSEIEVFKKYMSV